MSGARVGVRVASAPTRKLLGAHPYVNVLDGKPFAELDILTGKHARRIWVDKTEVDLFGIVELIDNNPLVCADEFSLPSSEGTLALIALGPLIKAGVLSAAPTAMYSFGAKTDSVEMALRSMGWHSGISVDEPEAPLVIGGLDQAVQDLEYTEERVRIQKLAQETRVPFVDLNRVAIEPAIIQLIDAALARRHKVLPIKSEENRLWVAMGKANDVQAMDAVRGVTGMKVLPALATKNQIQKSIDNYYGKAQVLSATFVVSTATLDEPAMIDDLYDGIYGGSFFVRRADGGQWTEDLVEGSPFASYRLCHAADKPESPLTVQVMADRDGKCGARQLVHAMNVMCGFEESLGTS